MNKKHVISSVFILIIIVFLIRIFSKNRKIETFEEDKTSPPPPPQEPPQPSQSPPTQQQQSQPPLPPIDPNEGKKEVNLDTMDKKLDLIINHFDIRAP